MSLNAESLPGRFWSKVLSVDDCWIWIGYRNRDGYGIFRLNGFSMLSHKVAYQAFVGAVPSGLELDHLCRVRACANPSHLETVTHLENTRRGECGYRKLWTHCIHGHQFTEANTYITPDGKRACRECRVRAQAEFRRRNAK